MSFSINLQVSNFNFHWLLQELVSDYGNCSSLGNSRTTVGQQSDNSRTSRTTVGQQSDNSRTTVGQQLDNSRTTVGQQSDNGRTTVGRVFSEEYLQFLMKNVKSLVYVLETCKFTRKELALVFYKQYVNLEPPC